MSDKDKKTGLEIIVDIPDAGLIEQDEVLINATKLFKDINGNDAKKIEGVKEFCYIIHEKGSVDRSLYINEISKKFKVPKKLFIDTLKAIDIETDQENEDNKYNGNGVNMPKITVIENFILKNFDVRYNEVANKFESRLKVKSSEPDEEWGFMNEYNILRSLKKAHVSTTLSETIEILKSDFTEIHNPLRDYFENLPEWDGKDHIKKLGGYLTIENQDKDRFGRMWEKLFPRMIACSLERNFNKQAFILIGKGDRNQNMGKTTFLRFFAEPKLLDYYTEEIPRDKDALIALAENAFINLDELSTFNKMEINWLKSMMSKDFIKVRLPYDRRASTLKRRCNFVGSTNEAKFLTDLTGNVRWIGFYVTDIDFGYSKEVDMDQVWAQAYHYLTKGKDGKKYNYQLTRDEIEENETANLEFMNLPPEMELIPKHYAPGTASDFHDFFTTSDFVKSLNEKASGSIKFYIVPVGKSLRKLGFAQSSKRVDGGNFPIKGYFVKFLTPDFTNGDVGEVKNINGINDNRKDSQYENK